MKASAIWVTLDKSWAEVRSEWKVVSQVLLLWNQEFILFYSVHLVSRGKRRSCSTQEKGREKKKQISSMTRSLIKKKLTSQWALPYKLVRHFIIEYIYLYQKHKKTFILGTRKIVTLQEHDSTIPVHVHSIRCPISWKGHPGQRSQLWAPKAALAWFPYQTETCIPKPRYPLSRYLLQTEVGTEPKITLENNQS